METGIEAWVEVDFTSGNAIYRPLHEVGRQQVVSAHIEPQKVGVEYLGRVVEAAGLTRVKELVAPPLVVNFQPAFFDVDVGRSIFTHGAELDDMATRGVFHNRPNEV